MVIRFVIGIIIVLLRLSLSNSSGMFDTIEFELGKAYGVSSSSDVSKETLQTVIKGVREGNKNSIYYYGLLKLYGVAVSKDPSIAASSFRRAAELGHPDGMTSYAVCLMTGNGVEENIQESVLWLKRGIEAGDMNAHWLLGRMYLESKGTIFSMTAEVRQSEAVRLITIASNKNIPQAQHFLGLIYEYGIHPYTQNFQRAAEYYRQAADQGYLESMYNLALMYAFGRGLPQDFQRAKTLFEAGARQQHAPSIYYMGVFKYHGYGELFDPYSIEEGGDGFKPRYQNPRTEHYKRDYNQALNWFEKAAGLGDDRVSAKALKIANEIKDLLAQAQQINTAVVESYQSRNNVE